MVNHEWEHADKNIQYRVLNAIVKEQIYNDQTLIHHYDDQLQIQYHCHILTVSVARKSALQRYVFTGEVIYSCGNKVINITSLESLLDILNRYFDITISEQLWEELIHSRDGLIESYKQLTHRQSLIKQSLKFSRLPQDINFITWLQHTSHYDGVDDLMYSESIVTEGHPTHPLTKTKLPLTMNELSLYAPEFEKTIPLHIMMIEQHHIVTTAMNHDDDFIMHLVLPEFDNQIRIFMKSLGLNYKNYKAILVHPWQYDYTINEAFNHWIEQKILIPTPFIVKSKATLSFRTMSLINKPFHVKLPVNVQATSAVRTVSTVTTVDGPKLSYVLQDMLNQYPKLQVAMEPFGEYADIDDDKARQLACIIRQKPEIKGFGVTVVSASLVNINPVDHKTVVDSYLEWLNHKIDANGIKTFIAHYTEILVTPLIAFIQRYGIALEAHMQNTVVHLGPNYDMSFLIRDLGGSRIDLDTLQSRIANMDITNQSLLAQSIEEVIAKFQHAVIQNQLAELIHHFTQYEGVNEAELFDIVRTKVNHAIDPQLDHAQALKDVLFGPTITVKALLNMRMENRVKIYLNIELDNPIAKEV
ncbi:siderophore synthetase [Staphylococcus simiae]|uniref:IucA/IucC family protein n=1 Tax=Staphylococcus simiae TaxID=308354 RepID=UPI001A96CAAD|nr:IucA/IucC family protein [Staphylococcus simiae]MBO1198032.1 siderophore synthetase [Staphylococcus simiae]MBO1200218.1 siderophore synthetase [Staphylococcus simiae]MBO1202491.1 siderophore synthetase [Staphylococcus simiae]MBO1210103.1 siderophore synthetase [Staphylococcus simiae]MBO1228635.1 siderophore synthetase [Staphylococcus simiae]